MLTLAKLSFSELLTVIYRDVAHMIAIDINHGAGAAHEIFSVVWLSCMSRVQSDWPAL